MRQEPGARNQEPGRPRGSPVQYTSYASRFVVLYGRPSRSPWPIYRQIFPLPLRSVPSGDMLETGAIARGVVVGGVYAARGPVFAGDIGYDEVTVVVCRDHVLHL